MLTDHWNTAQARQMGSGGGEGDREWKEGMARPRRARQARQAGVEVEGGEGKGNHHKQKSPPPSHLPGSAARDGEERKDE